LVPDREHTSSYTNAGGKPRHSVTRHGIRCIQTVGFERAAPICQPQGSGFESLSRSEFAILSCESIATAAFEFENRRVWEFENAVISICSRPLA